MEKNTETNALIVGEQKEGEKNLEEACTSLVAQVWKAEEEKVEGVRIQEALKLLCVERQRKINSFEVRLLLGRRADNADIVR